MLNSKIDGLCVCKAQASQVSINTITQHVYWGQYFTVTWSSVCLGWLMLLSSIFSTQILAYFLQFLK